jgi:DedD protein
VASLTERAKADAMAGNLKSKGFPAFVEEAEVNGRTYYRVRVGPRKERKDIDALAASVRDKTGQSGQIQRY